MQILGVTKFDQCVLNMSLINICNQESYVGKQMRKTYTSWKEEKAEAVRNPWLDLLQFTIYVPHPDQEYENMTLGEGLTKGYNVEVQPIEDTSKVPYNIPAGGHLVAILKQKGLEENFGIAATGIFIRPLGVLSLDIIVDLEKGEYQSLLVKHPIIRDYPDGWEQKLKLFIQRQIRSEDLPNLVGYVDQAINEDYRQPSWNEVYSPERGLIHF